MSLKLNGQFKSEFKTAKTNRPSHSQCHCCSSVFHHSHCHRWISAVLEADGWAHLTPHSSCAGKGMGLTMGLTIGAAGLTIGAALTIAENHTSHRVIHRQNHPCWTRGPFVHLLCGTNHTTPQSHATCVLTDLVKKYWFLGVHDLQDWRWYVINQDVSRHQWGSWVEWLQQVSIETEKMKQVVTRMSCCHLIIKVVFSSQIVKDTWHATFAHTYACRNAFVEAYCVYHATLHMSTHWCARYIFMTTWGQLVQHLSSRGQRFQNRFCINTKTCTWNLNSILDDSASMLWVKTTQHI